MPAAESADRYQPEREYRRSFLLLRWLLVILAAYLTLFSYIEKSSFIGVFVFVGAFAVSNVVCMLLPGKAFPLEGTPAALSIADFCFVAVTFYLLRSPSTYLYLPFILVFLLTVIWRDLRIVAFSIIAVSLLYGVFSSFRLASVFAEVEQFLTLSIFFVVSVFYLFLSDRLRRDAQLTAIVVEGKRRAEIMAEITRSVTSTLHSDEILYLIVSRLSQVFGAIECSIVRLDPKTNTLTVLVNSVGRDTKELGIDLASIPELALAHESRKLLFVPQTERAGVVQSLLAMPMVAQGAVLGVILVRLPGTWTELSEEDERFFNLMALTAANALRNAQLFEEMEHRARTDFLTGLGNHRSFQSTLAAEMSRAQRHNRPLSLLIIDLDFLKDVNDRFGHPAGDTVIGTIGETIRASCRDSDFAARYGGEEYTVILPETPLLGAIQVAERIRERIAATVFPGGVGGVTASIGISNYPVNALGREDLIRVADQALYVAKNNGRDRVSYFSYQLTTR